jgi:hypothetical protein
VEFRPFMTDPKVRQRYWSRSTVGWPIISHARPNATHLALARLEALEIVSLLITQNVDGLHSAAGGQNVIDLHGRLNLVRCMQCGHTCRARIYRLPSGEQNPPAEAAARVAPDGDVDIENRDYCCRARLPRCGASPNPMSCSARTCRDRVTRAFEGVATRMRCSSSGRRSWYSGYRFAEAAAAWKPIAAVNLAHAPIICLRSRSGAVMRC